MKSLKPKPDTVVADVVEGEAVIINVETGIYYSTGGVGGWIWSNLAAGVPCEAVRERLIAISREENAGPAFDSFVAKLREEGLVEDADAAADEALPPPHSYGTPELIIYRDMKELMALDPPMPILDDHSV